MPFRDVYRRQAALLVRVLPHVAREKAFALKGGTAINLFVRDMPRLSVDIDLTYLPVQERAVSLAAIEAALRRIAAGLKKSIGGQINEGVTEGRVTKLFVHVERVQVKIEVNPVIRGCVFPVKMCDVRPLVEETFGFAEMQLVSFPDLYAGKAVAGLDRQHPRDFFDWRDLLANEGITDELRRTFLVYMVSHDRPMFEVLAAPRKDLPERFAREFDGMTEEPVTIDDLAAAREALIAGMVGDMPNAHREFLLSFERGQPDWKIIGIAHVAELPAVKWRRVNLNKLAPAERATLVAELEKVLSK
ncbi:MAG: nucleotidyl transferase AbiEii/AbiGii toxin family protein [Xanthobacteraceae bacterium]